MSLEGTLCQLVADYDLVDRALARTPHFIRLAMDSREMFADGRVQLQVIGGQLRRLPRRIETIGSQLERTFRAEHKDVPRPPGTRMDRFVGRGADDHPGWRGAYRRCGATFGLGGVAPSSPRRRTPTVPRGGVVGLAGRLLVLRPLRTSVMRSTLIAWMASKRPDVP